MINNKSARCKDLIKEKKKMAAWVNKGKKKTTVKDHEKIINIQERIIRAHEKRFTSQEVIHAELFVEYLVLKKKYEEQEEQLMLAYKDRNEAIRRYNALHALGQMAKDCGVDLTRKLPENEKDKWDFNIKTRVLESGKTTFTATSKKKKIKKKGK